MGNQDEDSEKKNIKEQKEKNIKEEEITERNKNKTPEKFLKERW